MPCKHPNSMVTEVTQDELLISLLNSTQSSLVTTPSCQKRNHNLNMLNLFSTCWWFTGLHLTSHLWSQSQHHFLNDRTRRLTQRTSSYDADLTTKCQVPIETSGTRTWLQCSQVGNKHTNAFRLLRAHASIDPLLLCTTICDCCTLATQKANPQSNNNGCGDFTNDMHTSYRHGRKRYARWIAHLATKPNTEFSCNNKLHVESVTAIWTFWIFFEHVGDSLHFIKAHRWSQSQHQFSW